MADEPTPSRDFAGLYRATVAPLRRYLARMLGDPAEAQDIAVLGRIENGVRRIRVLHSIDELRADGKLLAMRISDGDFGKSEIIAILSRRNLFDIRRPRDESVASFAEALAAIQTEAPGNILAVASRLRDSRP